MTSRMPRRFARLPVRRADAGWRVAVAATWRARLLGLAGLRALPDRVALLLPDCRSIHTFGMRFALDLVWLDAAGAVVRVDRDVRPRRVRWCRRARSVLEAPAGTGARLARAAGGEERSTASRAERARYSPGPARGRRRAARTASPTAAATASATSAQAVTTAAATTTNATAAAAARAAGANRASSSGSGR